MAYLNYTKPELQALFAFYGNKCLACESPKPTIDHVTPSSLGGLDVLQNIQPLCRSCNARKGSNTVDFRPAPYPHARVIDNPVVDLDAKIILRMPADIHAWVQEQAASNYRSMNSEIIILLQKYKKQALRTSPKTLPYTDEPT